MLSEKGYGPDIMHLVSVGDLGNIGMSPGDSIHLRVMNSIGVWVDTHMVLAR